MFNGTLTSRFEKDKDHLKVLMRDFTYNFEKYFFKEDIGKFPYNPHQQIAFSTMSR